MIGTLEANVNMSKAHQWYNVLNKGTNQTNPEMRSSKKVNGAIVESNIN